MFKYKVWIVFCIVAIHYGSVQTKINQELTPTNCQPSCKEHQTCNELNVCECVEGYETSGDDTCELKKAELNVKIEKDGSVIVKPSENIASNPLEIEKKHDDKPTAEKDNNKQITTTTTESVNADDAEQTLNEEGGNVAVKPSEVVATIPLELEKKHNDKPTDEKVNNKQTTTITTESINADDEEQTLKPNENIYKINADFSGTLSTPKSSNFYKSSTTPSSNDDTSTECPKGFIFYSNSCRPIIDTENDCNINTTLCRNNTSCNEKVGICECLPGFVLLKIPATVTAAPATESATASPFTEESICIEFDLLHYELYNDNLTFYKALGISCIAVALIVFVIFIYKQCS